MSWTFQITILISFPRQLRSQIVPVQDPRLFKGIFCCKEFLWVMSCRLKNSTPILGGQVFCKNCLFFKGRFQFYVAGNAPFTLSCQPYDAHLMYALYAATMTRRWHLDLLAELSSNRTSDSFVEIGWHYSELYCRKSIYMAYLPRDPLSKFSQEDVDSREFASSTCGILQSLISVGGHISLHIIKGSHALNLLLAFLRHLGG